MGKISYDDKLYNNTLCRPLAAVERLESQLEIEQNVVGQNHQRPPTTHAIGHLSSMHRT